jgi:hypothetical protein
MPPNGHCVSAADGLEPGGFTWLRFSLLAGDALLLGSMSPLGFLAAPPARA